MIDRVEILVSALRQFVSRNRWSARLLGADPVIGHADEPGLILIQVDGLGEQVFRKALADGKMPFLRHLIRDEGYAPHPLYSGMASNTPCFQAELLYGVKGVVPGFGFLEPDLEGGVAVMSQPASAALVERRLQAAGHEGLLRGGSAWSDIFAGEAAESHFCSSTAGLNKLLRALSPFRMIGLVLWHGWSVVRVAAQVVAETLLALTDVVRGQIAGRAFLRELRFVPERVLVSAVLREVVTAGACVDADRGLPVVHLNLLGYDEHAHRRGPDSKFATWTLRGIDKTIRRVWLAAHRSKNRDYQVWIYSDHGQEAVRSYESVHGEDVADAIRRAWVRFSGEDGSGPDGPRVAWSAGERNPRTRHIARELPPWFLTRGLRQGAEDDGADGTAPHEEADVAIVHRGPIGFVYLPPDTAPERRFAFAEQVAREAHVPHVLVKDAGGGARVWADGGREWKLPGDEEAIFGPDHPHAAELCGDVLRLVHHERAGDLVLWSWQPGDPLSFKPESGAHGGPGPRETTAFFVVPPEMASRVPQGRTLRPLDLRNLARCVLDPSCAHLPSPPAEPGEPAGDRARLRLMTYNVHGCRGMDGRYSVERIARVIARERPDVVCLQELDHRRTRSGGVDQAREIAARLEQEYHFHSVREAADGLFGDAILSALPLHLVRAAPLPGIESRLELEPRGVLWVEVEAGGHRVQVLNTHLSISERERRLQADALVGPEWLGDARCDGPLLLAGDLNATSSSYTGRRLASVLRDTARVRTRAPGEPRPLTWSGRMPVLRIDHVFASGHFDVLRLDVPRTRLTRTASDHLPLVVDLEWQPAGVPDEGTPAMPGTAARTS
jgi:endonuclease/exonuclease/phosphatase family metal-dependent hydrolase